MQKQDFFKEFVKRPKAKIVLLVTQLFFITSLCGQTTIVYKDLKIPAPLNWSSAKSTDFKINLHRLNKYPNGFLYGNQQSLERLGTYLSRDAAGQQLWKEEANNAAKVLNRWDFNRNDLGLEYIGCFCSDRYIYCVSQLERLSMVYLYTGNKELGQFIRAQVLQVADLPYEFWLHKELRGYDPNFPLGMLETSDLSSTLAMTMSATKELYTKTEKDRIDNALRMKGLHPCLNWLNKSVGSGMNYSGVISAGAYTAARYLDDAEGMAKALKKMADYLNGSIEVDGSYGEGMSYFDYPIKTLLSAILCMSKEERIETFSKSGLQNSASWRVYPYLYARKGEQLQPAVVNFGDNTYFATTKQSVNMILASIYKDRLAVWLKNKFSATFDFKEMLLEYAVNEGLPEAKEPAQAGLPLLKTFSNGESFIRSTWKDNGIVFSLWSGDGSRVNFSHQRPELNSICMGAYGENLVVSPGAASYRSRLRVEWDVTTKAANTITVDDKNQLFPGVPIVRSAPDKAYNSEFWVQGVPKAEVIQTKAGKLADLLVAEASKAYHVPLKNARRTVLFVRDPGYFVIIDKVEAVATDHKFSWRLHLNNKDSLGKLTIIDSSHWFFSRPMANLDVFLFSNQRLETKLESGYLHGPGRDYSPNGSNEGKLGSSIEIQAYNIKNVQQIVYYSVLYPSKKGLSAPAVVCIENKIKIGKDSIEFSNGDCLLMTDGKTERYRLWEQEE